MILRALLFTISFLLVLQSNAQKDTKPLVLILGSSVSQTEIKGDSSWSFLLRERLRDNFDFKILMRYDLNSYQTLANNMQNPKDRPAIDPEANITKGLHYKPDILIISFTSNEVYQGFGVEEYFRNIDLLIKEAKRFHVKKIILATPLQNNKLNIVQEKNFNNIVHITQKKYKQIADLSSICSEKGNAIFSNYNSEDTFKNHAKINTEIANFFANILLE